MTPGETLIFISIVAQIGGLFYWGGKLSQQVKTNTEDIQSLNKAVFGK